jgi:dUTP pyrophosphatase
MNMTKVPLKVESISADVQTPSYQHEDDAGADICAAMNCTIKPMQRVSIPTGLRIEVPSGYELQVRSRSGLALNHGIMVLNSPGTIDSGYRGKVILINFSDNVFEIKKGDRIAQVVLSKVECAEYIKTENLSKTERGGDGFGSTGK